MSNTLRGINEDLTEDVRRPHIREFNHKPLPDDKQKIFTKQARAFLSKISELESNIDKSMNLI